MIKAFPSRAMQSRCIVIPMRRATREEAARLEEFSEEHEEELTVFGRKYARWAADIPALPPCPKASTGLINRIWLNWRPLLQIAALAGGTWPERALAAAQADMKRVAEEKDDSVEYALLEALWQVLARDKSNPRRMHTADIIREPRNRDDGRWLVANNGREVDDYYLRDRLKKLLPTTGYFSTEKSRKWRPPNSPKGNPIRGYHELHLADSFARYLGRGLPSEAKEEVESEDEDSQPETAKDTPEERQYPFYMGTPRIHPTHPVLELKTKTLQIDTLIRIPPRHPTLCRMAMRHGGTRSPSVGCHPTPCRIKVEHPTQENIRKINMLIQKSRMVG
jgi:hypothetical protein